MSYYHFLLKSQEERQAERELSMHIAGRLTEAIPARFISEPVETLIGAAFAAQLPDGQIIAVTIAVQDEDGPLIFAGVR